MTDQDLARTIDKVILHCSATKASMDIGAEDIDRWHRSRKPPFRKIGYHWVIRRDGTIERGRPEAEMGAHCFSQNRGSIGICLVGGIGEDLNPVFNFTMAQIKALDELVKGILRRYPGATIHGHNEFSSKACPCFDVGSLFESAPA